MSVVSCSCLRTPLIAHSTIQDIFVPPRSSIKRSKSKSSDILNDKYTTVLGKGTVGNNNQWSRHDAYVTNVPNVVLDAASKCLPLRPEVPCICSVKAASIFPHGCKFSVLDIICLFCTSRSTCVISM